MPSCAAGGQNLRLDAARQQRILDLQIADRMHRMRPADGIGADLRQADVPDVTGLHHLGDGADGILDRHVRIEPRRTIDVDIIGTQAAQAVGQKILYRPRTRVIEAEAAGGIAERAELDADLHVLPRTAAQRLGDQKLVVAGAVEIPGVEQRDAGIERGVNGGDALRLVGGTVDIGHAHAAKADG